MQLKINRTERNRRNYEAIKGNYCFPAQAHKRGMVCFLSSEISILIAELEICFFLLAC